jgi:hypothetical protein
MDTVTLSRNLDASADALESMEHESQLLFREARRRARRRRLRWLSMALVGATVAGVLFSAAYGAFGSSSAPTRTSSASLVARATPKVLTCRGTTVARPSTFVITCADAYTQLTKTHWTTWSSSEATGVTTFAMNLCTPNCAASKMSYFPGSRVRLSSPLNTSHGRVFSSLVVRYTITGHTKTFRFSFRGDPSLAE